ncbi:MAG TPA: APC family permease [Deinococcales bacterium]|nr:APC family permease [Deinococcales bacterium]
MIGAPLPTERAGEEKLDRAKALAVFASDAISSTAYSIEEILLVLILAGTSALSASLPVLAGILVLLWLLILSYRQTISKYPAGGGAYNVSKDNLGNTAGLVAGASLLVDYTLTVSVSVAAGISAIISAAPGLAPYRVELNVLAIVLVAVMNLRGIRESGSVFAIPPYVFIGSLLLMIVVGAIQIVLHGIPPAPVQVQHLAASSPLTLFLVLRAFAGGCTALTGVEAVSNGVPNFRSPATINARATLVSLGVIATVLSTGLAALAQAYRIVPDETGTRTVLSMIAASVFAQGSLMFWVVQIATMAILVLAANTAFNGFPLLASLMARDGYLPRQFNHVGDRLVFSNGIIILAGASVLLNIVFKGVVTHLIPLYAIGVFLSFTLSQAGMVKRWLTRREDGWRLGVAISGLGGIVSAVVLVVFAITKFALGAWIVLILLPMLMIGLNAIHAHYISVAEQLSLAGGRPPVRLRRNQVIVLVGNLHRGVVRALEYARTLSPDVKAVFVDTDPVLSERLKGRWAQWGQDMPLEILPSRYRSTTQPLFNYIREHDTGRKDEVITVVIPEFVPRHWWQQFLHNQTALSLKAALLFRRNTIVVSVPFHLDD